jgi:hypothetical protein
MLEEVFKELRRRPSPASSKRFASSRFLHPPPPSILHAYNTHQLYKRRAEVQAQVEAGTYNFDFLPETAHIREVRSTYMFSLPSSPKEARVVVDRH